jgi:hypothetical protein
MRMSSMDSGKCAVICFSNAQSIIHVSHRKWEPLPKLPRDRVRLRIEQWE